MQMSPSRIKIWDANKCSVTITTPASHISVTRHKTCCFGVSCIPPEVAEKKMVKPDYTDKSLFLSCIIETVNTPLFKHATTGRSNKALAFTAILKL